MSTQFTGRDTDTTGQARDAAAQTADTAKDQAAQTVGTAKDQAAQTAATARHAAAQTADTTKQEASNVASTASSAASDVVGTTKEQASNVAGEAVHQVRDLGEQVRSQLSEQAGAAAAKLAQALRSLAEELHQMSHHDGDNHGAASQAAHTLAERGDRFADYLENRDPDTMVTDLRGSAARRPGGFLVGAVVAGVLAGRFVRGNKAASDEAAQENGSTSSTPAVTRTSTTGVSDRHDRLAPGPVDSTYGYDSPLGTTAPAADPYGTTRTDAGLR